MVKHSCFKQTEKARKMKPITVGDQKFTNKATYIDFAGPILAKASEINKQKDVLREIGLGNHFGKDFTLSIESASKGGGADVKALKDLALKHGATIAEIDACIVPKSPSAHKVSFTKNKGV
tara:strand:+ start:94 stop:456 length:363 start_codon:yes stop_codon:yes gene_type:complete